MTKHIITTILFVACLLTACGTDNYDPALVSDGTNEELSLTISSTDIVVSDGQATRADDQGSTTVFKTEDNDCVGLIILDNDGRLLADNVPFILDGNDWKFYADNDEGKERVYYDGTMSTYIVYYPYDKAADGVRDVSTLKSLKVFECQTDQSDEDVYRHSDLMVGTGNVSRHLDVKLGHVRNSFSLDIKIKWELGIPFPNENTLEYHPVRDALVDFKVCYDYEGGTNILSVNDSIDYTFQAEDGTLRYILPDDYKGIITWRYTYRGESFGGESNVSSLSGVRYVQDTSAEISREKIEPHDYYSYKEINKVNYGFVMPWDAVECFSDYRPIGIVFYVGQNEYDASDYTESGINQEKCHGYVIALTDAFLSNSLDTEQKSYKLQWAATGSTAVTNSVTNTDTNDWNGFDNLIKMRNYSNSGNVVDGAIFPAAYACEIFSGYNKRFAPPCNTTCWFLPTYAMLTAIMSDKNMNKSFEFIYDYSLSDLDQAEKTQLFDDNMDGYWTSTEYSLNISKDVTQALFKRTSNVTGKTNSDKVVTKYVRPILAF